VETAGFEANESSESEKQILLESLLRDARE